jgi:AraC-like DNA-binding protein
MRFSLDGVPERGRRSQVREFFGVELTKYDIEPEPDGAAHVDGTLKVLPGLIMISGRGNGYRALRSRETMAAQGSDDIALGINLGGPLQFTHGVQELVLGDGDAVLVSLADLYRFAHRPPGGLLALRVPRDQIAPLVTGVEDRCYRRIPACEPALKFLLDYARIAEGEQRIACANLRHLFVRHVYDLMALMIGATQDAAELAHGRGLKAARLNAIKRDIAGNIDHSDLSVNALAARHGLTPRCVQRLFEAEGVTFTEYVVSQRLARAHHMLSDPSRETDKISAIAWDCGFGDISHFNHLFRRRYGLSPTDVRTRARESVQ